jgi:hypothetical protein
LNVIKPMCMDVQARRAGAQDSLFIMDGGYQG